MNESTASQQPVRHAWGAAVLCLLAGGVVFQCFGNSVRGYIDTSSLLWWWVSQWIDPRAECEHGWLILGLALWLGWRNLRNEEGGVGKVECGVRKAEWPTHNAEPETQNGAAATAAMLGGLALHALGYAAQQDRLSIVGLLLFSWGGLTLGGGRRSGRATAFPLAFMLFAVPVSFLDSLGFYLRLWVTGATAGLAHLAHLGVVRNGTQLFAPDGRYQYDVAAACSGVRSLMALMALTLLAGYLNFRSWFRRGVIFALCLPLAFLGNILRITTIVFAGEWFGQRAGESVHAAAGFLVFAVVLGGVLGAVTLWLRFRPEAGGPAGAPRPDATPPSQPPRAGRSRRAVAGATALVLAAAGLTAWFTTRVDRWPVAPVAGVRLAADGINPVALPDFLAAGWAGRDVAVTAIEREVLPSDTGYSRRLYYSLRDPAQQVFLSIVLSGRDRTSIHRPEICLVGQGWTIEGQFAHRFVWPGRPGGYVPATVLRITREQVTPAGGRQRVAALFAYWFVGGDAVVATHGERMWLTATDRLVRFQSDRWAYAVAQTLAGDGEEAALARLQEVVGMALPVFQKVSAGP